MAAELAGVHPQTLRIYERKGLIEPSRTEGRSRRYSDRDIALLQRIQELTNEGVSLVGVRKILDLEAELERLRARVAAIDAALDARPTTTPEAAVRDVHRSYRRDLVPVEPGRGAGAPPLSDHGSLSYGAGRSARRTEVLQPEWIDTRGFVGPTRSGSRSCCRPVDDPPVNVALRISAQC